MSRNAQLQRLCQLSTLLEEQALAPLARAQASIARTDAEIELLAQHQAQLAAQVADPVLAALTARQSVRLRQARTQLLQRLAEQTAELETHKAKARTAVGRRHALQSLLHQTRAQPRR